MAHETYEPKPLDVSGVFLTPTEEYLLERLAEHNHDIWAQERIGKGWSCGPKRNDSSKTNPCLVPFASLPPNEQKLDKDAVRGILLAIKKLGFQLQGVVSDEVFLRAVDSSEEHLPESLLEASSDLSDEGKEHLKKIIGTGRPMRVLFFKVSNMAKIHMPVSLQGETGTGKEVVAKALHYLSPRHNKNFVPINCGGLRDSNMLHSMIFGHVKGSYSGATTNRNGAVEQAKDGTLFLDEIGHMPAEMQDLLMRFLESGEYRKLGSDRAEKAEVRIITATNRNMYDLVAQGIFREDLMYRLNMFMPIYIPSLRERGEDIPELVKTLCPELSIDVDAKVDFFRFLGSFSWRGNIRQLKSTILMLQAYLGNKKISADNLNNIKSYLERVLDERAQTTALPIVVAGKDHEKIIKYLDSVETAIITHANEQGADLNTFQPQGRDTVGDRRKSYHSVTNFIKMKRNEIGQLARQHEDKWPLTRRLRTWQNHISPT